MPVLTGKVESKARNGRGIKMDGSWYNGTKELLSTVEWKDEVKMTVDGKNVIALEKVGGAAPSSSGGGGGYNSDERQKVIMYQSSRKDAVEVAGAVLAAGILPLPSTKADKFDAYMSFVDELTDRFYDEAEEVYLTGGLPNRPTKEEG